ncbi:hypothetical protein CL634_09625 [bacterium]|nr:hypothetical protein [bacterium]
MSKEVLVEALKMFKYSVDGFTIQLAKKGEEVYILESSAKVLGSEHPPVVKLIDEDFKPTVFHENIEETKIEEKAIEEAEQIASEAGATEVDENPIEDLEARVDEAPDGADEIELNLAFKAVQKSGKWYDIYKLDEKVNDKGVARNKIAKFVHELMSEG